MIDDHVLNITRWEGMEKHLERELWIAQRDLDGRGNYTTVEVVPSEWVAPIEGGKPVRAGRFNGYILYVRAGSGSFKEAYKEATKNETWN